MSLSSLSVLTSQKYYHLNMSENEIKMKLLVPENRQVKNVDPSQDYLSHTKTARLNTDNQVRNSVMLVIGKLSTDVVPEFQT